MAGPKRSNLRLPLLVVVVEVVASEVVSVGVVVALATEAVFVLVVALEGVVEGASAAIAGMEIVVVEALVVTEEVEVEV